MGTCEACTEISPAKYDAEIVQLIVSTSKAHSLVDINITINRSPERVRHGHIAAERQGKKATIESEAKCSRAGCRVEVCRIEVLSRGTS